MDESSKLATGQAFTKSPHQSRECEGDSCGFASRESFPKVNIPTAFDSVWHFLPTFSFHLDGGRELYVTEHHSPDIVLTKLRPHLTLQILLI